MSSARPVSAPFPAVIFPRVHFFAARIGSAAPLSLLGSSFFVFPARVKVQPFRSCARPAASASGYLLCSPCPFSKSLIFMWISLWIVTGRCRYSSLSRWIKRLKYSWFKLLSHGDFMNATISYSVKCM
jgi:hypothetical protein